MIVRWALPTLLLHLMIVKEVIMSEHNLFNKHTLSEPIADLLREIQQTPEEYWPNLLQMIRLFRESVTMKSAQSDAWKKAMDEINNPDPEKKATQQKALSELLKKLEEEGDEQEQTETAEILRKA
ncbi:MAG TPA: hypothetical protein VIQ31_32705, partial [Phormidium sp.]